MTPDLLELEIGAPAAGGACVARADDGRVVFVRHALPGERVRAVVTATTTSFLRADAVEVLRASPHRVPPPCPFAGPGRCGGCDYQHVALPEQRALKAALVAEQLRRLAGTSYDVTVEQVPGAPDGLGWRTRVQWAVDGAGRVGLHRHRSRELELVDRCLIATEGAQLPLAATWPGVSAVEAFSLAGQTVLSVRGRPDPLPPVEAGLVLNGRPVRTPHGVRVPVLGRSFEVAAGAFWQVHPGAATALAQAVLDGLAPVPGDRVVDLYAGVGLFAALFGAAVGPTGSVLAVEGESRACADALRNTADLAWVKVRTAAVDAALVASRVGRPGLVVLDPPRAGAHEQVSALASSGIARIAYVSCNPATFARDAETLAKGGYKLMWVQPVGQFRWSTHIELVSAFSRA